MKTPDKSQATSNPGRESAGRCGPSPCWAVGDSVVIADRSEAHGDKGCVDHIQPNGIILVELEHGCIWPVTADDLQPND